MLPRLLRAAAIAIAIVGVVDPSFMRTRPVPATVAVVDTTPTGTVPDGLAERVAHSLADSFAVVRHALPGETAIVAVGDRPPENVETSDAPGFAVVSEPPQRSVGIAGVDAPDRVPLEARVAIRATVRASGSKGRRIEVTLASGSLVVDRVTHDVVADDEQFDAPLTFVPGAEGLAALRVTALDAADAGAKGVADLAIDVRRRPWSVLVFDAHPSWASTFVRRALEHDGQFAVMARVDTSQDAATNIGEPPASLAGLDALRAFDAIVVGAPDDLTAGDVAGLEAFARQRAGAIVLILEKAPSAKLDPLLRVDRWTESTNASPLFVDATAPMTARLTSAELVWPDIMPPGAETLATVSIAGVNRPAIWRLPLGPGRVVVSGALDAWRSRAVAASAFDEYWRAVVADVAQGSPSALAVTLEPALAAAGDAVVVRVTMRDLATSPAAAGPAGIARAVMTATIDGPNNSTPLRLWPDDAPGTWRGLVRAPSQPGTYRIVATSGALTAAAPMRVSSSVAHAAPDGRDSLRAWAASRSGSSVPASRLADVRDLVARAVQVASAPQRWRPLRSPWWIMPFALLLGGEWWWRRRRGLL